MNPLRKNSRLSSSQGQSLIETALLVPLLMLIIFNAINFGYFFLVALHMASAPREGVQYSIMGYETPGQLSLPLAGPSTNVDSISYVTYKDMAALTGTAGAEVQVCTSTLGISGTGASTKANCTRFNGSTVFTPDADPEAPLFILHRVDVQYTVTPLINAGPIFGVTGVFLPNLTFHRQVSMRQM